MAAHVLVGCDFVWLCLFCLYAESLYFQYVLKVVIKKLRVWVLILDLEWTYWTIGKAILDASGCFFILPPLSSKPPLPFLLDCCYGLETVCSFSYLVTSSSYLNLLIGNHIPEPLYLRDRQPATWLPPPCSRSRLPALLWWLVAGSLPRGSLPAPLLGSPSSGYSLSCFLALFPHLLLDEMLPLQRACSNYTLKLDSLFYFVSHSGT